MTSLQPDLQALANESDRQYRVVDQMATLQSMMRDRARVQGVLLVCLPLVASAVGIAFAFAGGSDMVAIFGVRAARSTWLGWFAIFTFAVTLVDLVVDRRGCAGRHDDAVRQLTTLKSDYRSLPEPASDAGERVRMTVRYQAVMDASPPLPERHFVKFKARHLRKVEISRYLSSHPGVSARTASRAVRKAAQP